MTARRARGGGRAASGAGAAADFRREIRSYWQLCSEIDRLLAAGRLSEARRLNDEARALFHHLYGREAS
jgi:hypothetical protein